MLMLPPYIWGAKHLYATSMKIQVYVGKEDEEKLKAKGVDPREWVRGLVKHGLKKLT